MASSPSPPTSPRLTFSPRVAPARVASPPAVNTDSNTSLQNAASFLSEDAESRDGRRLSIQFAPPSSSDLGLPTGSPKVLTQGGSRRMSSPPPPSTFESRVSFDTFDNRDASDFSLTLNSKHREYRYSRRSRTFLCGTDSNDYSEFALEWLIDELVDDGDEIVCLRVVDKDSKISSDASVEEGRYRTEARKLLDQIISKNTEEKAISLVLEFSVGKVHDTIQRMIRIYEPAMLIVGTRGRSLGGIQGLLPGSVSKYCLQHSPVPVIVVRPSSKREKKKKKRLADPSRRGYMDILERSGAKGEHVLDRKNRDNLVAPAPVAPDSHEAAAVAAAIGIPAALEPEPSPLSKVMSVQSDATTNESVGGFSDEGMGVVMKSPEFQNLDSPVMSQSSEDEEEGDFEAIPGHSMIPDLAESGEASTNHLDNPPQLQIFPPDAKADDAGKDTNQDNGT